MTDYLRYKKLYFAISALFLIPGLVSLGLWGLKPAIDFTGGTLWEVRFEDSEPTAESVADEVSGEISEVTLEQVKSALEEFELEEFELVEARDTGDNAFLLKFSPLEKEIKDRIETKLKERVGAFSEVRFETVGPTLGRELLTKTVLGIVLAALLIMGYVAWRFKDRMYGICAILAMFHDTLIVLGIFSLLGRFLGVEVDTLFVTAVLTVLSFSVHDTVVVYDRIRELRRLMRKESFEEVVNQAIADTLVRSVNNSLTIIFMLLALLILGGQTIRWFAVALLAGTIAGTYSSTFTAAPLLVVWDNWTNHKSSKQKKGKKKK